MMPMYDPWEEAVKKGLETIEMDMLIAGGYYCRDYQLIIVNKNLSSPQKREALAHELAHHDYSAGIAICCESYLESIYQGAHEKFIDRKAAEKLMPIEDVEAYLKNNPEATVYELAEFFSVTERMARIRIESLINKGGI